MLLSGYYGCVYIAINRLNGRAYIGKTIRGLALRQRYHRTDAAARRSRGIFSKAIRAYGFDAFDWHELFLSNDDAALCLAEKALIADYRRHGTSLYNLTDGGQGIQGLARTPEHRAKIAAAHRGRKQDPEKSRKHSEFMRGRTLAPEHRAAISASMRGYRQSPEHTAKIRAFHLGRKRSDETRARISEANRRRWAAKTETPL